jgi:pimeloyl-ACP methyl ester carboxylesterase
MSHNPLYIHPQKPMTMSPTSSHAFELMVQGRRLEVQRIEIRRSETDAATGSPAPELVFLHEGLGSISLWKDFPARVAAATGCPATIYSRDGHGASDPLTEPRPVRFMHDEALQSLPDLLAQLHIENPILIGHSDGGSIALIYAGSNQAGSNQAGTDDRVRGLVLLAPHVFVEDLSIASITQAKGNFETTNLPDKLARHHRDAARTFRGWNDIWLHPDFRAWNIEEYLPRIRCPILAIQGLDDEYGTKAQVQAIKAKSGGPVEILALENCGHSAHRDQPDAVLQAITEFVKSIREAEPTGARDKPGVSAL